MTDDLLSWMLLSGGSLDWFMSGGPRGMAVAFRRAERPTAQLSDPLRRLDDTERSLSVEAIHAGAGGGEALTQALASCQARMDAHRARKAASPCPSRVSEDRQAGGLLPVLLG